ncbi:MAG: hypothetical protein ACO25L_01275 [Candidatus Nanopelagicales bacterium]|nr:tail tube monomer [Synechococcus phage DSL-LC03]
MSSNQKLYYPIESIRNTFSKVSISSFYKVAFPISGGLKKWLEKTGVYDKNKSNGLDPIENIELLCSGAVLPGPRYKTTEVMGNRQGILEQYPLMKQYPELALTFYVDHNHNVIKFFEEWMNYISPLQNNKVGDVDANNKGLKSKEAKSESDYYRLRYPDSYTQTLYITKFERDMMAATPKISNGKQSGYTYQMSPTLTYEFVKAYPYNIIASPVSYEGSTILTYTVNFIYTRYFVNTETPKKASSLTIPDIKVGSFDISKLINSGTLNNILGSLNK